MHECDLAEPESLASLGGSAPGVVDGILSTYYDLLINACVRYDKTKKANIGKRRNVYATNIDDTYIDSPTPCIDHVLDSPYGGIDLPPDEFYQVHALSSRHQPSHRPGQPSRPPFKATITTS